jgi:hypothetical protein
MPLHPFGDFLAAVAHLAERDAGPDGRAAREYLDAFSRRRQIVAGSSAKYELLGELAGAIKAADGALVFTETVRAANHAINRLDPHVSIDLITGTTARRRRQEILGDLRQRRLDAVAAPRVLDEGIDVPDANLGIVLSASRTRRQMVQRMGRVLRRKRAGVAASFVIVYAEGTLEDPATSAERDGFLDELERIAEATLVVRSGRTDDLEAFLARPGPEVVPDPERLDRWRGVMGDALAEVGDAADLPPAAEVVVAAVAARTGVEAAYAYLCLAAPDLPAPLPAAARRVLGPRLPAPVEHAQADGEGDGEGDGEAGPYLALDLAQLPEISTPKVEPHRISTGHAPLELESTEAGWQLCCTGCGGCSPPVRFRWQVFEQTVDCRCA